LFWGDAKSLLDLGQLVCAEGTSVAKRGIYEKALHGNTEIAQTFCIIIHLDGILFAIAGEEYKMPAVAMHDAPGLS
jgi:hypothetical protein